MFNNTSVSQEVFNWVEPCYGFSKSCKPEKEKHNTLSASFSLGLELAAVI